MVIKKSELYSTIWKSCDELRVGMNASQYKDYVLVLLFVKYVSDKYAGQLQPTIVVPPGGRFAAMQVAKGKPNIEEQLNTIITALAEANELKNIIDTADFDDNTKLGDGKEMQDRHSPIGSLFLKIPRLILVKTGPMVTILLGDAYECFIRQVA